MRHLVFVYGTLKEGFPNFAKNKGVHVPGAFRTLQRYPLYLMGERYSPWLINDPGHGDRVSGQVFEVDHPALATMDILERIGEPDGYCRVAIVLESRQNGCNQLVNAFAYLKQAEHFQPSMVRAGCLSEYTLDHAALYQPKA